MTAAQQLEIRGEKRGIQLGMQEGMQQGMQRGMQQGIQQEKLHIAKNMLFSNEAKEKIQQFTGLSWKEIEELRHDQK